MTASQKSVSHGMPSAVALLLLLAAMPAFSADYGRPPAITPSDLYAERDIPVVSQDGSIRWIPPTQEYISSHIAAPEYPQMRDEFAIWARALLAPQWLPADLVEEAPYLRRGTGRESRHHSHFYAAYRLHSHEFMAKGFLPDVRVTIKPPPGSLPVHVTAALAEAVALHEMTEPGHWGAGQDYSEAASRDLKAYLRDIAEQYFNRLSLPASEPEWHAALAGVTAVNRGFKINWPVHAYQSYMPEVWTSGSRGEPHSVYCTLWTNGCVIRMQLGHDGVWAHDFSAFLDSFPKPAPAPLPPLNPEAVEMWDMCYWKGLDGPVDDPARATSTVIKVVVKAPYAPNVGEDMSGPETGGQPWWGNQVRYPPTPLQWHIAEFAALLGATSLDVFHSNSAYHADRFCESLGKAADRAKFLEEARTRRDNCSAIAARFSTLRYPSEVQAERHEMLGALRAGVQAWDKALAYWEPIVAEHPEASDTFYSLRGEGLKQQLAVSGLENTAQRIGEAADIAVPLFQKFGLQ